MLRMKNLINACLIVCLLFSGCRKDGKDKTEVTFVNRINQVVTLNIYSSLEDYKNSTNAYIRQTIPASDKLIIGGNTLKSGQTYFMDWYTDNYTHNNWFNDRYNDNNLDKDYVVIQPVPGNNTYYTDELFKGDARLVYLENTKSQTSWRAVNYYAESAQGFESKWDNLPEYQKYKKVVVRKDFIAEYEYKDSVGNIQKMLLPFKVHHIDVAYIELYDDLTNKVLGQMTSGRLPGSGNSDYKSSSKDSVLALLPGLDYKFLMVRE